MQYSNSIQCNYTDIDFGCFGKLGKVLAGYKLEQDLVYACVSVCFSFLGGGGGGWGDRCRHQVTDKMQRDRAMSHPSPRRAPLLNLQRLLDDYLFITLPQQSHNHWQEGRRGVVGSIRALFSSEAYWRHNTKSSAASDMVLIGLMGNHKVQSSTMCSDTQGRQLCNGWELNH